MEKNEFRYKKSSTPKSKTKASRGFFRKFGESFHGSLSSLNEIGHTVEQPKPKGKHFSLENLIALNLDSPKLKFRKKNGKIRPEIVIESLFNFFSRPFQPITGSESVNDNKQNSSTFLNEQLLFVFLRETKQKQERKIFARFSLDDQKKNFVPTSNVDRVRLVLKDLEKNVRKVFSEKSFQQTFFSPNSEWKNRRFSEI